MDSTTNNVTDDQELAKVLETMNQQATGAAPAIPTDDSTQPTTDGSAPQDGQATTDGLSFEETPAPEVEVAPAPAELPSVPEITPADPALSTPATPSASYDAPAATTSPELDAIKKDALAELRPLVDKLNLPADEKFDTLLLIIRSTDDKSLVTAAHEAARAIEDETKRAQALLDVIKEIDYFSGHGEQPA